MGLLFPVLLLLMSAYVLVGAIKGNGRLFSLENFKDDCKEKGKKVLRAIYFALAGIMLLMAVVNFAQSSLYGSSQAYYRVTDAYRESFPELAKDELVYTATSQSSGMSCLGTTSSGQTKTIKADPTSQTLTLEQLSALINKAAENHQDELDKYFPVTSAGLMSCLGGSQRDYSKYYEQTNLIKVVNGEDVPVYATTDAEKAEGHVVYTSSYGKVRSDANDGSFTSKLYGFLSPTLLTVLNYVFLGLAVAMLVLLFVITSKFTDKEKLRKARAQQSGVGASMPSGAFNFTEEDKK